MYMYVRYERSLAAVCGRFHGKVRKLKIIYTVHANQVDSTTSFCF